MREVQKMYMRMCMFSNIFFSYNFLFSSQKVSVLTSEILIEEEKREKSPSKVRVSNWSRFSSNLGIGKQTHFNRTTAHNQLMDEIEEEYGCEPKDLSKFVPGDYTLNCVNLLVWFVIIFIDTCLLTRKYFTSEMIIFGKFWSNSAN